MQRELKLDFERPLADGLTQAITSMVESARDEERRAAESPASAVHNYRRSLRRAEAVLDLAWPVLRRGSRKWLADSIGRARRGTRLARDVEAVMPLVGKLEELEILAPGDVTLLAVRAWLESRRTEAANDELVAWRLRKNVRALAGVPEVFEANLEPWVDVETVLERIRQSYRQARRVFRVAGKTRKLADVHALRRAIRKLRYQLELLASIEPPAETSGEQSAAGTPDEGASAGAGAAGGEAGDAPEEPGGRGSLAWLELAREQHRTMKALAKDFGYVSDLAAMRELLREAKRKQKKSGFDPKRLLVILGELTKGNIERVLINAATALATSPKRFLKPPEPKEPEEADAAPKEPAESEAAKADDAETAKAPAAPEAAETPETAEVAQAAETPETAEAAEAAPAPGAA